MTVGQERHLFAGGNTAYGFYSFYEYIAPPDAARTMIVKGGPGVGKSTLMKWMGHEMQTRGYAVEYFHCSSDKDSLDAIRIPQLEVSLIDGTAPHAMDPMHPGAVDEIVYLGDYWDETGIRTHKSSILAARAEASRAFRHAYRLLAAAKNVKEIIVAANQEGFHHGRANETAASVIASVFGHRPVSADVGRVRHLFASAITPSGFHSHIDSLVAPLARKIVITGSPGTRKSTVMAKVVTAAEERGYSVEAFHCGFDPKRIEHALIPALDCAVITSATPHMYTPDEAKVINMDLCRQATAVAANAELIEECDRLFAGLLEQAVVLLAKAKHFHDELESYYAPHMDFAGIGELRNKLLARVLACPN